jgi:voltage-gated potassium channel
MSSNAPIVIRRDRRRRRQLALGAGLRCLLSGAGALLVYAHLPLDGLGESRVLVRLLLATIAFLAVVGWQARSILRSEYPQLRALEVLVTALAILVVMFAYGYVRLSTADPASFTEPLGHAAGIYFTTTVLATVGFGDISPVSSTARLIVSFQMMLDLVFIGVMVRLLFTVAQHGIARRDAAA